MAWREKINDWASSEFDGDPHGASIVADQLQRVLLTMLDHDRIAFARELLAGTEYSAERTSVVVGDASALVIEGCTFTNRAAMMEVE